VPKLLEKVGLDKDDIDVYELNEAFASQSVYCIQKIGLDPNKVNPNGGAIAIGRTSHLNDHLLTTDPLGATGGRLIATILAQLGETGGKFGVTSMCASTGQGMATLVVRE
jgi:acetyl-CoA acyltransferase 1